MDGASRNANVIAKFPSQPTMTFDLPVWYLQAGPKTAAGEFVFQSQASAVLLAVKNRKTKKIHKLLVTAQHALRTGADRRSGAYHPAIRVWPPAVGYHPSTGKFVTIFSELTPEEVAVLAEPEDFAFLELPADAGGSPPCRLAEDRNCIVGLEGLTIVGFVGGEANILNHNAKVEYASYLNWRFVSTDEAKGIRIVAPGEGIPDGGGSGGGVFHGDQFMGIYRGAFLTAGEHLFLPITRLREWCGLRGFDLEDPSSNSIKVAEISQSIAHMTREMHNSGLQALVAASSDLIRKLRADLALFKSYKDLHDRLHQVQIRLPRVESAARNLATDPMAADQMDEFLASFSAEKGGMQAAINTLPMTPPTLRMKEAAWLKLFDEAIKTGRGGLARSDEESARFAAKMFRRVLRVHLPRINGELSVCAEAMNLLGLRELFANATDLPGLSAEAKKSFEGAQITTGQVSQRLQAQLKLHSAWQDVDGNLWSAEDALSHWQTDPGDFDALWNALFRDLGRIMASQPAGDWVHDLSPLINEVDAKRRSNDWPGVSKAFPRMQRACRVRFFDVDNDLRNLADEATTIGDALNTLPAKPMP